MELRRRKMIGRAFSGNSLFASRVICGDCGGYYGQKVWHSNQPGRKVIWRYNRKYIRGCSTHCAMPNLTEETIKTLFIKSADILY